MHARLLIVGGVGLTQVGEALLLGAKTLGYQATQIDTAAASQGPRVLRALSWRLFGHRPLRLQSFSKAVERQCMALKPQLMITTGPAPVVAESLKRLTAMGVRSANYSTDDPYSKVSGASHYRAALPHYDYMFTPRIANMAELQRDCKNVSYLPFGYDPRYCHDAEPTPETAAQLHSEVLIVGGGDDDRAPIAKAVLRAGHKLAIYGAYWQPYRELRDAIRGHVNPETLRLATRSAEIVLGLVRRVNRDGHVMRSIEAAASGGCLLLEDTEEHRTIFGSEWQNAAYFHNEASMLEKIAKLKSDPSLRAQMQASVVRLIHSKPHRYQDRLETMVKHCLG
jgi:spore maturation protein CgeB